MKNVSRYIAIVASLLIITVIFYYFSNIVAYVLIAWVLSLIGQPLMRFFQQKAKIGKLRIGPSFSAVLTIISYFINNTNRHKSNTNKASFFNSVNFIFRIILLILFIMKKSFITFFTIICKKVL